MDSSVNDLPNQYCQEIFRFLLDVAAFNIGYSNKRIQEDPENCSKTLVIELTYNGNDSRQTIRDTITNTSLPFRKIFAEKHQLNFIAILQ